MAKGTFTLILILTFLKKIGIDWLLVMTGIYLRQLYSNKNK